MSDAAELAAGFRRLRPVVRDWLARDLAGPPGEYTRAYADLMFAYAFAHLGAADDARRLTAEAGAALAADDPATRPLGHGPDPRVVSLVLRHLAEMFRHRIDEALSGRPPRPTLPRDLLPTVPATGPVNSPESTAKYATDRVRGCSRILEPAGHIDVYSGWTMNHGGLRGRASHLLHDPDRDDLEGVLGELLAAADREPPDQRLAFWRDLLPLAALAGEGFRTGLLLRVPDVVADALPKLDPSDRQAEDDRYLLPVRELVSCALRQAAAMPAAEFFPPLTDAALGVISAAASPARFAADLGWDCLCWFRRLGAGDEADAFLHRARGYWPAGDPDQPEDVRAAAVHAGLLNVAGREAEATAQLNAAAAVLVRVRDERRTPWQPRDTVAAATAYARSASTDRTGVDRLAALFPLLRPVSNTWVTAQYYSRSHLELVDAMLLAFPAVRGA
ncbi:MAG: hypothetical protein C0501_06015 [Isosphaera sp.]|nr:hypothetical protein [Isosphaera sp.]